MFSFKSFTFFPHLTKTFGNEQARPLLNRGLEEDGDFGELVDPFLEGNYNPQELKRMAACAASSIRHSAKKRSKMSQVYTRLLKTQQNLMSCLVHQDKKFENSNEFVNYVQIVRTLEGDVSLDDLKEGIKPSAVPAASVSSEYDTMQYNADMQKFRKAVFSNSTEFGTSSCSSGEQKQP